MTTPQDFLSVICSFPGTSRDKDWRMMGWGLHQANPSALRHRPSGGRWKVHRSPAALNMVVNVVNMRFNLVLLAGRWLPQYWVICGPG